MVAIAISGKMGSGKTTLTQEIIRQLDIMGISAQQVSLGAAVKDVANRYFGMDPATKDRVLLQKIGQQFREIRPSVWIDLIIDEVSDVDTVYICDDVRFQNELSALTTAGWKTIRLQVSESEQKRRIQTTYQNSWESHWRARNEISETDLDNYESEFDTIIPEITIDEVEHHAQKIVSVILNSREVLS